MTIRNAAPSDLDRLMELEMLTFPAAEAAEPATFAYRIAHFGEWFLVAEEEGRIVGFINARPTSDPVIMDGLYETHDLPIGKSLAILCLETDPVRQRRGVAGMLLREIIERARNAGMQSLVLACKNHLIPYYAKFGFAVAGVSASAHGGAKWNDMTLDLKTAQDMIEYRTNEPIAAQTLAALYRSVGWEGYADRPDALAQAARRSVFSAAAWESGHLVGFMRVVGDGAFIAYIQDILVRPDRQRSGVGSRLLQLALKSCSDIRQIVLLTDDTPQTRAFYEKNGFSEPDRLGLVSYVRFNPQTR